MRTGIPAIDHVDVVAHESYTQLLRTKDSLLERIASVAPSLGGLVDAEGMPPVSTELPDGTVRITPGVVGEPGDGDGVLGGMSEADLLIIQSVDTSAVSIERDIEAIGQHLPFVPGRPRVVFPRRERALVPVPFSLESVDMDAVAIAGQQHRVNYEVSLQARRSSPTAISTTR